MSHETGQQQDIFILYIIYLVYTEDKEKESKRKKHRKVILFNPPYSANVAAKFLSIIDKHFQKH